MNALPLISLGGQGVIAIITLSAVVLLYLVAKAIMRWLDNMKKD
jgi:hypothetical protein